MTRGPRRLIDDPDFKWETGCDLGDEALQVGGYDLPGMKDSLLARIAETPPPVGDGVPAVRAGGSWTAAIKPLLGAAVGASLLAGAYWLGTQSTPVPEATPAPPVEHEAPMVAPPVQPDPDPVTSPDLDPDPDPVAVLDAEPEPLAEAPEPVAVAPEVEPEPEPEIVAEPEPEPEPENDAVAEVDEPAETSGVQAQMDMYEPAADALETGRYTAAVHGFRVYLDAWPDGVMRTEAELGLLQALFESGDAQGTAELARALQDRRALADRREDILRLRAESLLLLDRCDEALLVAEQLPARAAAPIRRGCRLKRRDTP